MRGLTRSMLVGMGCVALSALGCGDRADSTDTRMERPAEKTPGVGTPAPATIDVDLAPKSGSELRGKARLEQRADGVLVRLDIDPGRSGTHAVHVHETADCSAPDASSAGEHFNPENHPHGLPPGDPRHLGDLGNIELGEQGGRLEILVPEATLSPGEPMSFVDRAIIVHADVDSGAQPSGNSGDRIACGEIRASS